MVPYPPSAESVFHFHEDWLRSCVFLPAPTASRKSAAPGRQLGKRRKESASYNVPKPSAADKGQHYPVAKQTLGCSTFEVGASRPWRERREYGPPECLPAFRRLVCGRPARLHVLPADHTDRRSPRFLHGQGS